MSASDRVVASIARERLVCSRCAGVQRIGIGAAFDTFDIGEGRRIRTVGHGTGFVARERHVDGCRHSSCINGIGVSAGFTTVDRVGVVAILNHKPILISAAKEAIRALTAGDRVVACTAFDGDACGIGTQVNRVGVVCAHNALNLGEGTV